MSRDEPAPRAAFNVWIPIVVRWGDMDAFGHVNNAAYFTYCESARIRYFEAVGLGHLVGTPEEGPAVVTATCNFRRQVHYPAELEVGARTSRVGRTSFVLEYGIFEAGGGERVADGSSVVVWVDYARGSSLPVPEGVRQRIAELDGADG